MTEPAKKLEAVKSETPQGVTSRGRALRSFEDMEQWFQDMFPRMMRPVNWEWPTISQMPHPFEGKTPRVDVIDRDEDVLVKAELPGVEKKDLDIKVTDHTVTIKGTSRYERKEEKGDYYRSEMAQGIITRTVSLPSEVDGEKAKAVFKDGLLELTLPKIPERNEHKVEID
jgi:HSP20 family protein